MNLPTIIKEQPKEVMIFGNKGIIKSTKDGLIKGIEVNVELSIRRKEIYGLSVGSGENKKTEYKITAEGFEKLYQAAALDTIPEQKFIMNGQEYTNPHIEFDDKRRKNKVITRQTVVGRDANGKVQYSSAFIIYDAGGLLLTTLMNKLKWDKKGELGFYCDREEYEEYKKTKEHRCRFYEIDEEFGMCIFTDTYEFKVAISTERDMRDTIERKAVTVARRNAIRRHPAIATYSVLPVKKFDSNGNYTDLVANVKVMRWMNLDDHPLEHAINEYIAQSEAGAFQPETITYEDDDEQFASNEGMIVNPEAFEAELEYVESVANDEEMIEKNGLIKRVKEGLQMISNEDYDNVIDAFGNDYKSMTITELQTIISSINKIMDEKARG